MANRFKAVRPRFSLDWAIWDHADSPMCHADEGYLSTNEDDVESVIFYETEEAAKWMANFLNELDSQRG